jgi:hypothetical protein
MGGRIFVRAHPWDQHSEKGGEGNRSGQKPSYDAGPITSAADPQRELWNWKHPSELSPVRPG